MDKKEQEKRLPRSRLMQGLIGQTAPNFLASSPVPIVSISAPLRHKKNAWTDKFLFSVLIRHARYDWPDWRRKRTRIDLVRKRGMGVIKAAGNQKIDRQFVHV